MKAVRDWNALTASQQESFDLDQNSEVEALQSSSVKLKAK